MKVEQETIFANNFFSSNQNGGSASVFKAKCLSLAFFKIEYYFRVKYQQLFTGVLYAATEIKLNISDDHKHQIWQSN